VSVLYCQSQALVGGENLVYDVSGALGRLYASAPVLAEALFSSDALRKFSPAMPSRELIGPAFVYAERDGLLTRYSDSQLFCEWSSRPAVREAVNLMRMLLNPSDNCNEFIRRVRLEPGQALILMNDRVAHGRTEFRESSSARRIMWRGLYREVYETCE